MKEVYKSHLKFAFNELRNAVEATKNHTLTVHQAAEIINGCGKMINAGKVEIEARLLLKRDPGVELEFLKEVSGEP